MGVSGDVRPSAGGALGAASATSGQLTGLGPWRRDAGAVLREWADVQARVADVTSRVPGSAELSDLGVPERFTVGVFFAGRWTLGVVSHRPLTGLVSPVSDAAIRAELGVAEYLLVSNAPTWDLAAGVRAWLSWLLGASEVLAYPQRRA